MGHDDLDIESSLVNLSGVDLELLRTLADSALAQSIQRFLHAAENPDEATMGFEDSI